MSTNRNVKLEEALAFDSFSEAEKFCGEKTDESLSLGFYFNMIASQQKNILLSEAKDSRLSTPLDEYLEITSRLGFQIVKIEDFEEDSTYVWSNDSQDGFISTPYKKVSQLFILWNADKSILLKFDTSPRYNINEETQEVYLESFSVNSGKFYYNWIPSNLDNRYNATSSGGFYKESGKSWDDLKEHIWVGDHDCRESIAHNITKLSEQGTFLKIWKEIPIYSFLHYLEWKPEHRNGYSGDEITIARLNSLPKEILDCIGSVEARFNR